MRFGVNIRIEIKVFIILLRATYENPIRILNWKKG